VSDYCLAPYVIYQLYLGENKLHFDSMMMLMMMISSLY